MRTLAVLAAALLTLVAGCGPPGVAPEERLAQALAQTYAESTARMAMEIHMSMGEEGGSRMDSVVQIEGEVDFAADRSRFSADMPMAGGQTITTIIDGSTVYMQVPFEQDGRWVRTEHDATAAGGPFGDLMMGSGDPTATLEALGAVEGELTQVRREDVRGVSTIHYRFAVDPQALFGDAAGLDASSIDPVAVEAWLDDDGRLRRLAHVIDFGQLLRAQDMPEEFDMPRPEGTMTTTLELFDFGVPVDIELPPEDQVTDQMQSFGSDSSDVMIEEWDGS